MNSKIRKVLDGIKNNSCSYQGFDEKIISSLVVYAKQYLEVLGILGYIDGDNTEMIVNQLKTIDFILPYHFYMQERKNMVLVDIPSCGDNILTRDEKIMLNTYQKIGECLLTGIHYHNVQLESLIMCTQGTVDVPDMINGFSLLVKALSQELAEQVLTYITGKHRSTRFINCPMFENKEIETDFHINENYQEPACLFSGVLLDEEKKSAFYELTQICLTKDFVAFITSSDDEKVNTLLIGLGCIKKVLDKKCSSDSKASIAMTLLEDSYDQVKKIYVVKKYQ